MWDWLPWLLGLNQRLLSIWEQQLDVLRFETGLCEGEKNKTVPAAEEEGARPSVWCVCVCV